MRNKLEEKDILRDKYGYSLRECDELRQGNTKYEVEIIRPWICCVVKQRRSKRNDGDTERS